jgi:hypothetical protein
MMTAITELATPVGTIIILSSSFPPTHRISLMDGLTRPRALPSQAQLSGRHQPHHLRLRERVLGQT